MSTLEKLANQIGQITFRIETNNATLRGRIACKEVQAETNFIQDAIQSDLEKLKTIKARLLDYDLPF